MESALAPRLIEYPADLSGCNSIGLGDRQLLYLCTQQGTSAFVVVLGFFSGQKEDFITKDLIEPVGEDRKTSIGEIVTKLVSAEYPNPHVFFL